MGDKDLNLALAGMPELIGALSHTTKGDVLNS